MKRDRTVLLPSDESEVKESKKVKFCDTVKAAREEEEGGGKVVERTRKLVTARVEAHPTGIQPYGNIYLDQQGPEKYQKIIAGLGGLCTLPEDVILEIFSYLPAKQLAIIAEVSKGFYLFSRESSLWKERVLSEFQGNFKYEKDWRVTYIKTKLSTDDENLLYRSELRFSGLYSDVLYQPWRCACVPLEQWARTDNIDRRSGLTREEFVKYYEKTNRPVIITDAVPKWPAFNNPEREWSKENLIKRFGDTVLKAGAVTMTLRDYWTYADQIRDETPIYLFDNEYGEKEPELLKDYEVPEYFKTDYFSLLDSEPKMRPSYRWVLFGPARSGSTFHKDPNYTSAWNGVIKGRKKWILFPPNITPPGVLPSKDQLDVTTPISVVEWFLSFYEHIRDSPVKPIECVQNPGELIFIPNQWWHTALNLEECIAVTQNYVSDHNLIAVKNFLHTTKKFKLLSTLEHEIHQKYPGLLEKLQSEHDKEVYDNSSIWDKLTADCDSSSTFKFGF